MSNLSSHSGSQPMDPKPKSVFVVSPIGTPGTAIYQDAMYALKYIFREALKGDEWDVHRADEGKSPDSIGQHVIRKLYEADLVVADLSGHNPNVFYELAIAHGWRKPVVHLIKKGENVPFDIVDQRTIFYDLSDLASVEDAVVKLREYANHALTHASELVNPLTSFETFSQIRADSADGGDAMAEALEQVVERLARIETVLVRSSYPQRDTTPRTESLDNQYRNLQDYAGALRALENRSKQDTIELLKTENQLAALTGRTADFVKAVHKALDAEDERGGA